MVLCLDMDLFFSLLTFYCVLFFITFTLFGFHVRVKITLLLFLFVCLYLFSSLIRFFFFFFFLIWIGFIGVSCKCMSVSFIILRTLKHRSYEIPPKKKKEVMRKERVQTY